MGGLVILDALPPADPVTERARTAWLLAADLADQAANVGFLKIYTTPGKVGRGSPNSITFPRRLALYLAVTVANCTIKDVADAARLDRKTVTGHVAWVEDAREEQPWLDAMLDQLERRLICRAASIVLARYGDVG